MCADPLTAALPVPEPSDVEQAASVQFDDIKQQLQNLKKDLGGRFSIGTNHNRFVEPKNELTCSAVFVFYRLRTKSGKNNR